MVAGEPVEVQLRVNVVVFVDSTILSEVTNGIPRRHKVIDFIKSLLLSNALNFTCGEIYSNKQVLIFIIFIGDDTGVYTLMTACNWRVCGGCLD